MIAYLVHAGVISDSGIGWMGVVGSDGMGHHSNTRVEMGCSSLLFWVSWDKVWTALFSPSMLQISMSGDHSVGLVVHIGKVGDDEKIGTAKKRQDGVRFRVQSGC